MPKARKTLRVRIPEYEHPRLAWRRKLHACFRAAIRESGVQFSESDRLEVEVRLYLNERAVEKHDVDNRLKDILDALQGRLGGPKSKRPFRPVVPNDNRIFRIVAEKRLPPPQSHGFGHLIIRKP